MLCPYCKNENKVDALTCEFCMKELPIDSKRQKDIKKHSKIQRKIKWNNSVVRLVGTLLGIALIILIIVIAWLKTRG